MLEKIYGKARHPVAVSQISEQLDQLDLHGTLYTGYPVIASADDAIFVEAMLVTVEHGLVIFDIVDDYNNFQGESLWEHLQERQDRLYFTINSNLSRHQSLRQGRELGVKINIISYCPEDISPPNEIAILVCGPTSLAAVLDHTERTQEDFLRPLNAALQRISTIKPIKKRTAVTTQGSRGAILREIERKIANLDQWQKRAAIESPEGPQRIRGLAGSGKTVVLALKAAYLHTLNPDWNIALTFYTRSLYQQFKDLVRRFTFEHINDEPNFDKLRLSATFAD